MKLFNNILCTFLGHKADKTVLAYNIKSHDTTYDVKVYEVSKCSRCNKIYEKNLLIGIKAMTGIQNLLRQKEKELRKQHIVSISEVYELLGKEKEIDKNGSSI